MSLRRHLTYANVISTLCLFLMLGGGAAVAATKLGKSSVGTEQLKGEAVTKGKLHPNSVNSKKVVNGSLTGEDIVSSSLGKVPNASYAENAGRASTAGSADSASTATNAEKLDGHTPEELGAILIATPSGTEPISGEMYFSVSGTLGFTHEIEGAAVILPNHRFRATDVAVRLERSGSITVNAHVSLVVNGVATEVCSVTTVPATCRPSLPAIEIPVGAQVAWRISTESPFGAQPRFAMRLGPA